MVYMDSPHCSITPSKIFFFVEQQTITESFFKHNNGYICFRKESSDATDVDNKNMTIPK